jgi:hypothetical protein
MTPVSVTPAQVQAFLNDTTPNPDPKKFKFNSPAAALFNCPVLPSTNLYSPDGWRATLDAIAENGGWEKMKQQSGRAQWLCNAPLARLALAGGWIHFGDLGIHQADLDAAFRDLWANPRSSSDRFLSRVQAWSWVSQVKFEAARIQPGGLADLRFLRAAGRLDLVDREKLIQQIASVQTLSATPPGQPAIHDWRDIRGLFFTPCWPALQDTCVSLAALEILGGLDRIDREACVAGILGRHQGAGYFTSPSSGGYNEYHIDGGARDTIAAFESLRMLGALDRVKDLEQWRFRVAASRQSRAGATGVRVPTWEEVEAWVCQRRLERILREKGAHPEKPVGSLLQAGNI